MGAVSNSTIASLALAMVVLLGACAQANLQTSPEAPPVAVIVEPVVQGPPDPDAGKQFFDSIRGGNCKICHYTNERRMVGPGMRNVTRRHTEDWLRMWLNDPQGTWRSGHPETEELRTRTRKNKVPVTACVKQPMTEKQVDDLISFLKTLETDQTP